MFSGLKRARERERDRRTNLKVAATEEEVDFEVVFGFSILKSFVNSVKVPMHTPFYCYPHLGEILEFGLWREAKPNSGFNVFFKSKCLKPYSTV